MRDVDTTRIHDWPDIAAHFHRSPLLLGNGFSLRFTDLFGYHSLFAEFLRDLPPASRPPFAALGSTDFELLLERFTAAIGINEAFGVHAPSVVTAATTLREGLLQAIHRVHPRHADLNQDRLQRASESLDAFGDVFTLNYDSVLYHIIMLSKDRYNMTPGTIRPYNDYCWRRRNADFLEFTGYQEYAHFDHVYYLHGALFLFRDGADTLKIRRRNDEDLLDRIGTAIAAGMLPLFVSEGTTEAKRIAISRSEYLRFALEHLRSAEPHLVIYGASLSPQDRHIVEAILHRRPAPQDHVSVAISLRLTGKSDAQLRTSIARYRDLLLPSPVEFFDADTLFV